MLHTETVTDETFGLLVDLMDDYHLKGFSLAGGTALSLYLGHRKSIDIDLFSQNSFNVPELSHHLKERYSFQEDFRGNNTLKGFIKDVKVDCISHRFGNVRPIKTVDKIRLYSIEDIAAMKLGAIADNETRLKDFVDIACLSTKISLSEMLESYQKKYRDTNAIRALRALTYYVDIIHEPIDLINGKYTWDSVNERIDEMIKDDMKVFHSMPFETFEP